MGQPARKPQMSYAEYLAAEKASEVKHEFVAGEMWAMSGGRPLHGRLAARMSHLLERSLGPRSCRPFSSDVRIFVPSRTGGLYPDLSVVCGKLEHDPRDPDAVTNPSAIVEVLSPTSAAWDRDGKFDHYASLPSVRDYVLVTQERNRVEHFARNDDGSWTYRDLRDGDTLRLTGAPAEVAIAELYEDVEDLRQGEGDAD